VGVARGARFGVRVEGASCGSGSGGVVVGGWRLLGWSFVSGGELLKCGGGSWVWVVGGGVVVSVRWSGSGLGDGLDWGVLGRHGWGVIACFSSERPSVLLTWVVLGCYVAFEGWPGVKLWPVFFQCGVGFGGWCCRIQNEVIVGMLIVYGALGWGVGWVVVGWVYDFSGGFGFMWPRLPVGLRSSWLAWSTIGEWSWGLA